MASEPQTRSCVQFRVEKLALIVPIDEGSETRESRFQPLLSLVAAVLALFGKVIS